MTIKEIYEKFDEIGSLTFSTLSEDGIESRIAHFFAFDDDGIYFRTMDSKPFFYQLIKHKTLSVCGIYPKSQISHDENNLPIFVPGYTVRISGKTRMLTAEEIERKAAADENFNVAVHDIKKYPATRIFVLYKAHGEYYDYDFACKGRDHKLLRTAFAFGGDTPDYAGLCIDDSCIGCGSCFDVCTFKAIEAGSPYSINGERCDECGSCRLVCPAEAIGLRHEKI